MSPFYLYVFLSMGLITLLALNISFSRIRFRIGLGDGGNLVIKKAIRAHINALEHCVPYGFIVFSLASLNVNADTINLLTAIFLIARLGHVASLYMSHGNLRRSSATVVYLVELYALVLLGIAL